MNPKDSYGQSYHRLQEIAERLSNNDEVDIDELVPLVDEATRAYQICQSRIEAVESALNKRLDKSDELVEG